MDQKEAKQRYWRANLRLVAACLVVWFTVSFGFGIVLADSLDNVSLLGVRLGFWFAQQGAIFGFIGIIFFYAWRMSHIDREHDVDEE
jgi:putative solute:sodium symporter small subunit